MSHRKSSLVVVLLICAASATGFWFGRNFHPETDVAENKTDESSPPIPTVQIQPLVAGSISQSIEAYGTIQPTVGSSSNVTVQFDAQVQMVRVSLGTPVTAETPVVDIGPTVEARLQLKQAQDSLAAADDNLRNIRSRFSQQLATNADVSAAEQAQKAAKTQTDSLIERGIQKSRTLCAGAVGVIAQVNVQAGQVIPAGTSLLVISAAEKNEAIIGVEPAAASVLKVGDKVELENIHASKDTSPIIGTIQRINQQLNAQTHLCDVAVSLPSESRLLAGSFVVAQLSTATAEGLIAPRSAVLPDDEDQVVFTLTDGKAKRHAVRIGLKNREQVQITCDELHAGDSLITVGNAELDDGMTVKADSAATKPETITPSSPAEDK